MLLMTTLAKRLQRWTSPAPPSPVYHSPTALRAALDRERARSDRSGTVFSFLTFTRSPEASGSGLNRVVDALQTRLRTTDEYGWLDDRRIGVVLLDAPATQAWLIADDVLRGWPAELPRPRCEVFSYPARVEGSIAHAPSTARGSGDEAPRARVFATTDTSDGERLIRPMQPLFVRPMPPWKRAVDATGAAVGLMLAAPVIGLAAAAIRLTSPGPAIFRQQRTGLGGSIFTIYKLRTMRLDADALKSELADRNEQDGPAFKIKDDPRVTPVGRFLRKTSIDELPQLYNVLRGDMSLVGPRPLPVAEAAACEPWQQRRVDVTPGLTGIWQVQGRARTGFTDWVRMDMRYIRARSLLSDLKLLILTIPAVILRKGAH